MLITKCKTENYLWQRSRGISLCELPGVGSPGVEDSPSLLTCSLTLKQMGVLGWQRANILDLLTQKLWHDSASCSLCYCCDTDVNALSCKTSRNLKFCFLCVCFVYFLLQLWIFPCRLSAGKASCNKAVLPCLFILFRQHLVANAESLTCTGL